MRIYDSKPRVCSFGLNQILQVMRLFEKRSDFLIKKADKKITIVPNTWRAKRWTKKNNYNAPIEVSHKMLGRMVEDICKAGFGAKSV